MDTFNMDTFNMDNDDELVAHADLVDEQNHAYEQCLQDDLNHAIAKQEAEEWRRIRLDSWWEEKRRAAARVPPEPAGDDASGDVVTVSLRYHGGTGRVASDSTRRFHRATTSLRDLWDYAFAQEAVPPCADVQLYTPMPRSLVLLSPDIRLIDTEWCAAHRYVRLHAEVILPEDA